MAEKTFEAQAAAVRSVVRKFMLSAHDRQHLAEAEKVLLKLAELRKKCLVQAESMSDADMDAFSDDLLVLLRLPRG